ncbi:MAG: universal stress protein [Acidobacteria bacterium]|nr:universal stress protein [Acidobacteriota bacterium]
MIRSILVALAEAPDDLSAKNYAFWLARKEGGHVHAVAVLDITAFEVPMIGTPDGFMPSVVPHSFRESQSLMDEMNARCRERLGRFAEECASRSISCSTETKTGIPAEVISQGAVAHDIVVVSRTGYNPTANTRETIDSLVAPVIRSSVRPVLVAGTEFQEESEVRNILVAYDGSNHSARALLVAAELADRPGADLTLVTVVPSEDSGTEILAPAEAFLAHHGVAPRKRIEVSSKPASVISQLVASGDFDLLIMGAYGHSPIREVLFGSTTERILSHCAANVILQS